MDHKMKQELMSRHRARLRESIAPGDSWGDGDPVARMIACWIIDIVADARELELSETNEHLLARAFTAGHHFAPVVDPTPERKAYDPKDVEVTIGDGVGDPRKFEGFEFSAQMTAAIHSTEVAITVDAMERLWEAEARVQVVDIESTTSAGRVGRFELVTHGDGSVWAWTLEEPGVTVMVVKPDPELSSDAG